jgi:hypothetical protein
MKNEKLYFNYRRKRNDINYYGHYNQCSHEPGDGLQYYSGNLFTSVSIGKKCNTWRDLKPTSGGNFDAQPEHSVDTAFDNVCDHNNLQDICNSPLIVTF